MIDPAVTQAVLDEVWEAEYEYVALAGRPPIAKFKRPGMMEPYEMDGERARQAALGHKALALLVRWVEDETSLDEIFAAVDAIHGELRGRED